MADNQEERIKKIIRFAGYSLESVAQKMGVTRQTVYNNIKSTPIDDIFKQRLEAVIGISVDKLPNSVNEEKAGRDELRSVKEALGDAQSKLYIEQEKNKALRAEIERLRKEIIELQNTRNTG